MNLRMSVFSVILLAAFLLPSFDSSAQFVALARKIKSRSGEGSEISSVVLDAWPMKVYQAMNDTLNNSPKLKVISRDDRKRQIMVTSGSSTLNLRVDSLSPKYCKIEVAARDEQQDPMQVQQKAVNAILAVCRKLGIPCTVEK